MKKETNILNITYDFPPSPFWGMGSSVKLLCDNIYKECNLVVATRYKEQKCSKKYPIIESSKETDSLFLTNEFDPNESYKDFELLLAWNTLFAKTIISYYEKNKLTPTVIHNHNWMTYPTAIILRDYFGSKIISSVHFFEKQYNKTENTSTNIDLNDIVKLEESILKDSNKVIFLSEESTLTMLNNYGSKVSSRFSVIPHGLDFDLINSVKKRHNNVIKNRCLRIIFVGRLVPEKGITYFLDSIGKVMTLVYIPFEVFVVGDGFLRETLEKKYSTMSIKFLGNISQLELFNLYDSADILCSPTLTETFGLVIIEGMAFENAVLTTVGPTVVNHIEDMKTGLTVKIEDTKKGLHINSSSLTKKLIKLISDNSLRKTLARNAAVKAKSKYNIKTEAKSILNIYKEVCHKT